MFDNAQFNLNYNQTCNVLKRPGRKIESLYNKFTVLYRYAVGSNAYFGVSEWQSIFWSGNAYFGVEMHISEWQCIFRSGNASQWANVRSEDVFKKSSLKTS